MRFWPNPAFLLQATIRGRRSRPNVDVALRIDVEGYSQSAVRSGVQFFSNMRVPPSSPIFHTSETHRDISHSESFGQWVTSRGGKLRDQQALTCAVHLGRVIYGIVSLI